MKNAIYFLLLSFVVLTTQTALKAQIISTWKGGTPGKKSDWYCPTNWKEGRVPNSFSSVIIPDISTSSFFYPVIETGEVEIQRLYCAPTAKVTVKNQGSLIVLDPESSDPYIENQRTAGMRFMAASSAGMRHKKQP